MLQLKHHPKFSNFFNKSNQKTTPTNNINNTKFMFAFNEERELED